MASSEELKYWVAFSRIAGIGRVRISRLKQYFGSLHDAWNASEARLKQAGLNTRSIEALLAARPTLSLITADQADKGSYVGKYVSRIDKLNAICFK